MKALYSAILISALALVGCNEEEVNALKAQNEDLQKGNVAHQEQNAAHQEQITNLEKQTDVLKAQIETLTITIGIAADQSASLKKEILALANQMADKEYESSGVFEIDGKLLKRTGYDEDLKQPAKEISYYMDLVKTLLSSYPNAENKPSVVDVNEAIQQWAHWKKEMIEESASLAAISEMPQFGAEERKVWLENQIQQALTLRGDELIDFAVGLELSGNPLPELFDKFLAGKRSISALRASGLGEKHPSILRSIISQRELESDLQGAVVVLEELLKTQLGIVNAQLAQLAQHDQRRKNFLDSIEKLFE